MNAVIQVLVGPDTGWVADTRLQIKTAPDGEGFLRIREIAEYRVPGSEPRSVEEAALGLVKAAYR